MNQKRCGQQDIVPMTVANVPSCTEGFLGFFNGFLEFLEIHKRIEEIHFKILKSLEIHLEVQKGTISLMIPQLYIK